MVAVSGPSIRILGPWQAPQHSVVVAVLGPSIRILGPWRSEKTSWTNLIKLLLKIPTSVLKVCPDLVTNLQAQASVQSHCYVSPGTPPLGGCPREALRGFREALHPSPGGTSPHFLKLAKKHWNSYTISTRVKFPSATYWYPRDLPSRLDFHDFLVQF